MNRTLSVIVGVVICLVGCESGQPETPVQAVESIIRLYEARDFDTLIRTRYAEIGKAGSDEQVRMLVERFATRFQDAAALEAAVSTYRETLSIPPEISEDGTVATFPLGDRFIKLSRMSDGRWGFHL